MMQHMKYYTETETQKIKPVLSKWL